MPGGLQRFVSVFAAVTQGEITGKVTKKVTSETRVKGHVAKATKEDPQFVVKSDKTGAKAVHKPASLKKA